MFQGELRSQGPVAPIASRLVDLEQEDVEASSSTMNLTSSQAIQYSGNPPKRNERRLGRLRCEIDAPPMLSTL